MNTPLVSIIIPTYNRAHLIGETLDSVLAQTYKNWECIVVDDGSTDYTQELLEFYTQNDSRIQFHHRPKYRKKGANTCRNYGIEKSLGEFLIFLDSDDVLNITCLYSRLSFSEENTGQDFYIFPMGMYDSKILNGEKRINNYPKKGNDYLGMFLRHDFPWPITSMFINKSKLQHGFAEELERFQDVLFSIELLMENSDFLVNRGEVDCFYRVDSIYINRYNDRKFIEIVLEAFYFYLKELDKLFKKKSRNIACEEWNRNILISYRFYCLKFILPNFLEFNHINQKIYDFLLKQNYFSKLSQYKFHLAFYIKRNFAFIKSYKKEKMIRNLVKS